MAPTRQAAHGAFDRFIASFAAKYPKASECLQKDRACLLAFYDFPAEHWGAFANHKSDRVGVRDDPSSQRSRQGVRDACDDARVHVQARDERRAELPQVEGFCASGESDRRRALRRWCRADRGSETQQSRRLIKLSYTRFDDSSHLKVLESSRRKRRVDHVGHSSTDAVQKIR